MVHRSQPSQDVWDSLLCPIFFCYRILQLCALSCISNMNIPDVGLISFVASWEFLKAQHSWAHNVCAKHHTYCVCLDLCTFAIGSGQIIEMWMKLKSAVSLIGTIEVCVMFTLYNLLYSRSVHNLLSTRYRKSPVILGTRSHTHKLLPSSSIHVLYRTKIFIAHCMAKMQLHPLPPPAALRVNRNFLQRKKL